MRHVAGDHLPWSFANPREGVWVDQLKVAAEEALRRVREPVIRRLRAQAVPLPSITAALWTVNPQARFVAAEEGAGFVDPSTLFSADEWQQAVADVIGPAVKEIVQQASADVAAALGFSFDVTNPATDRIVGEHVAGIGAWGEQLQQEIIDTVHEGIANGWSIDRIAGELEGERLAAESAQTIAQTETIAAQNGAALSTYQAAQVEMKQWVTAYDDRVRPSHVSAGSLEPIGLDELFPVGGGYGAYPGDPQLPLKERVRCRCKIVPVVNGDIVDGELPGRVYDGTLDDMFTVPPDADIHQAVDVFGSRGRYVEPNLTGEMRTVAKDARGYLEGLDFRLKSNNSLAEKIERDMTEKAAQGLTAAQAAAQIDDAVRYTMVFEDDVYWAKQAEVLADLQSRGYSIVPGKFKNMWYDLEDPARGAYRGINVQLYNPDGYAFELQFHTPSSYDMKFNTTHHDYESWRKLDPLSQQAVDLYQKMLHLFDTVPIPPGAVPGLVASLSWSALVAAPATVAGVGIGDVVVYYKVLGTVDGRAFTWLYRWSLERAGEILDTDTGWRAALSPSLWRFGEENDGIEISVVEARSIAESLGWPAAVTIPPAPVPAQLD